MKGCFSLSLQLLHGSLLLLQTSSHGFHNAGLKQLCSSDRQTDGQYLKLQSESFASLSPSLFETCHCSYLRNYFHYVGCVPAMFWSECVAPVLRNHRFSPTSWNIWPKSEFSPDIVIRTSNMSATFILTNWGNFSITINCATNGD